MITTLNINLEHFFPPLAQNSPLSSFLRTQETPDDSTITDIKENARLP